MTGRTVATFSYLASALLFAAAGVLCIVQPAILSTAPVASARVLLMSTGAMSVLAFGAHRRPHRAATAVLGLLYFFLAAVLRMYPELFSPSFLGLTGSMAYLGALARFVYAVQMHREGERGMLRSSVDGLVSLVYAFFVAFPPPMPPDVQNILAGIYLIYYAMVLSGDFLRELLRWDEDGTKIKRYMRFPMPVFLSTLVPLRILGHINRLVRPTPGEVVIENRARPDAVPNLEIFIHLASDCARGLGHVDLSIDGMVYSYGCYDLSISRFFTLASEGVLAVAPRDPYLAHCLKTEHKAVVGFGILLDAQQRAAVYARITQLMKKTRPWRCEQSLHPDVPMKDATSTLYREAGAQYYKFRRGKYKYYFALVTNCVQLTDALVGAAGLNLHGNNGIITPGTYMTFLNDLFRRKDSCVVSRTVYF